ncbi:carboxynorspermidine decarboxylase [Porphyromonas macacae]|uniref:Carboxynorspermidine/carboxyspermidine decarboxylase n=1 Tax=Porphyromonas macacae TaxID=28115 RepID=A0A0A2E7L3_9PORP|nr:carboxynorspermidine decarboxylase [Porphyromonas macacae]KGN72449.1 carboxynorspermidine decarboxylase [Porphyromonas macacae]
MKEMDDPQRPAYVLEEELLRKNLELIRSVADRAGVEIILAFKAYALWKTFPIIREYIPYSTASSIFEARLAYYEMDSPAHTFSPAYKRDEFEEICRLSSHVTFNSLSQFEALKDIAGASSVSLGLRINPEFSAIETELYNPCAPGSRFGVPASEMPDLLPQEIEGLHFHSLCEGSAEDLRQTLVIVEKNFASALKQVKWLNMGGGHLMTRKDYDVELLVDTLRSFQSRHPHLQLIMEPGSAFGWQTGYLRSHVIDIVEHQGIRTAIVDVSFTCHMPDCLEMPYHPVIRGAQHTHEYNAAENIYRIGGNSCLSGDYMGNWLFDKELQIGDEIIFEDMLHYTTVKTNMFNGIPHPDIVLKRTNGSMEVLRRYGYEDYKGRMD